MIDTITQRQFIQLADYIKQHFGIVYGISKREILAARSRKIIVKYNLKGFDELLYQLMKEQDKEIFQDFANAITVNKTDFFREIPHFEYILENKEYILSNNSYMPGTDQIRAWSAACSTGEEPYTLAMVLDEVFHGKYDIKILATDIDTNVLKKAQIGAYNLSSMVDIPKKFADKYVYSDENQCWMNQSIKDMIAFRQFNLMHNFPFSKKFDLIFCRNVMIYFDRETQIELVKKFHGALNPGGLLFTGHSETLPDKSLRFKYIRPAIYRKM